LHPTDYGVYAVDNDSLIELQPLPGRAPDIRVAVSAALKMPGHTVLPNGHPKFIVFRRDIAANFSDRAEDRRQDRPRILRRGRRQETGGWRHVGHPKRFIPISNLAAAGQS